MISSTRAHRVFVPTSSTSRRRSRGPRDGRKYAPYVLLLPFAALFVALRVIPIGYAIVESFYKTKASGLGLGAPTTSFSGFSNFTEVLTKGYFWSGVERVVLYGIVQVPFKMALAMVLALILDSGLVRFGRIFRFSYFLPYAVPGVIAAILWGFLYYPSLSPVVGVIRHLPGAGGFTPLGGSSLLWSIANIATWAGAGFDMLIFIASLQTIPTELIEAARVDGASEWRIATRVKVRMIGPAVGLSAIFSVIGTLQLFTEPKVLASLSTSVTSQYTPNIYAYTEALVAGRYHYAAAVSVSLALITFVVSFAVLGFISKRGGLQ